MALGERGELEKYFKSVTSPDGSAITKYYDQTGDKVWDHSQTIATATVSGVKTETLKNYQGDVSAAVCRPTHSIWKVRGWKIRLFLQGHKHSR